MIDPTVHVVDASRVEYCAGRIQRGDKFAIDTETTTDPWYSDNFRLLVVAIAFDDETWVVPVDHPEYFGEDGVTLLKDLFDSAQDKEPIMQNGAFDYLALRAYDVWLGPKWFDTLGVQYLLDVEAPKGLEALVQRWLQEPPWKDIDYKKPEEESLDKLSRLCARDAYATLLLHDPMLEALQAVPALDRLYHVMLQPAMHALAEMEWRGVPIDLDRLADLTSKVEEELEETLASIRWMCSEPELNPNSTMQLQKVLFGKFGLPVTTFTPKGAPSTSAEALRKIEDMHGAIPLLQKYRKLRKLLTASLRPWAEHAQWDGKLHPRYKPAFVKTGRLSSENPNIQQVPRDPEVRSLFGGVAGYRVVELDYSQLELRIMAWLSGEPRMLEAYERGEDLHQITADALGVDRHTGKTANFGLLYGAGYRKLREIAESEYGVKMSEAEAERLRVEWFATYPEVEDFHEQAIRDARHDGGVTTIIGRWRPLPDLYSSDWGPKGGAERQAVNTPIQSVASDLTLSVLTDLVNADWLIKRGITPMITVHDSIIFLVPEDQLAAVDLIKSAMEHPGWKRKFGIDLGVPLLVDVKEGKYWGETK